MRAQVRPPFKTLAAQWLCTGSRRRGRRPGSPSRIAPPVSPFAGPGRRRGNRLQHPRRRVLGLHPVIPVGRPGKPRLQPPETATIWPGQRGGRRPAHSEQAYASRTNVLVIGTFRTRLMVHALSVSRNSVST